MSEWESAVISQARGTVGPGFGHVQRMMPNPNENLVIVEVVSLMFADEAPVLRNSRINKLFVEYRFLNIPPEQLETPYALPKPNSADKLVFFNFCKVFEVDYESNYERRQYLAAMLQPGESE